jgi:murein DD-endopeptidase MepM/ murein hydrolase activator NlpD
MINIIIVSDKMAKAKTLSTLQTMLLVFGLVLVPVLLILLFITPKQVIKEHGVRGMLPPNLKGSIISSQSHLDAYAKQIGELQARIMRLDAQNERLAKLAGVKMQTPGAGQQGAEQQKLPSSSSMNRGGPLLRDKPMSEKDLRATIAAMVEDLDMRDEYQGTVEARLLQQSVLKDMLPNSSPVSAPFSSSSYGWRIDPFNGHKAFHEGLDFPASMGTPIFAAADGIVSAVEGGGAYGNLLKIDHGSGLETRYAHNSRILVKVGDRINKGQKIALVGSTGRSTGPHLHYEIRLNGNALDPRQYLRRNAS